MTNTGTGWTKEWPDDGVYWFRLDAGSLPDIAEIWGGDVYYTGDKVGVSVRNHDGGEWLGPISPSDVEQLIQLRSLMQGGIGIIAQERQRHFDVEGWTPEHDDEHDNGELAQAGACYAWPPMRPIFVKQAWPWRHDEWKPELFSVGAGENEKREARIRVLAKAGALIAAEIDRLQRLNPDLPKETQ